MKTTMKLFAAITLMFGFSMSMFAQDSKTAVIPAYATVFTEINVEPFLSLEFGAVVVGFDKTISTTGAATGGGNPSQQGVRQGIGKITRALGTAVDYNLTTTTGTLTNGGSATTDNMTFDNYTTAYSIGAPNAAQTGGAPLVTTSTTVPSSTINDLVYVHIGATVHPNAGQAAGLYTGTITLSAEYN